MKKTVFGIVGLGNIANSQHLPNLTRATNIHLKTICDLNRELLESATKKYGPPVATTDFNELLKDPEIQCVCIATQENIQAELTIQALNAGKHVYVEKPLAKTREECEAVVRKQAETGLNVVLGFNRRLAPAYVKAKEIITSLEGASNIHYRLSDQGRMNRERVIREMCHVFDIVRFFSDSEAISMYCVESRSDEETYVIKFASGAVASIVATGYAGMDLPKERIEVFTRKGDGIVRWDGIENGGCVIVEDFVELTTFGIPGIEHKITFPGHSHPDREFTHKYLLKSMGGAALHGIRRMIWEMDQQQHNGEIDTSNREELMKYCSGPNSTNPRPNYMVDKGWLHNLAYLAECVSKEEKTIKAASAEDAWKVSCLCHAAIESRESGEVVKLS